MNKLLLIDGNSLINRSYYAIRLLSNKNGIYTNAITGFLSALLKLRNNLSPDCIAVAFDLRAPTFRHKMYDGYKKRRKGMPEELAMQMPYIKEILDYMGIARVECEGFEADDIIGTLSRISDSVLIATGDRDAFQLINEKVSVVHASTKEEITYTPDKIKEVYGITPEQFVDVKALMGDSSDDIPGVAGIGEKTAFALIQKYDNITYIYDNLESLVISPAVRNKLEKGKEVCFLSRDLAEISTVVPIELNIDKYRINQGNPQKLAEILSELEIFSIMKRLEIEPVHIKEAAPHIAETPLPPNITFKSELAAHLLNVDVSEYTPEQLYSMIIDGNLKKLMFEVETPLIEVLADMNKIGICVDVDGIKRLGKELELQITEISSLIHQIAGTTEDDFNISSPKQLGEILFDKLNLPHIKKTKSGYSTDSDVLESLAEKHEIVPLIIEYRALTKLNSTYVNGMLEHVSGNRIHTTFKQTETRTGRLSSVEPNIQNIPVRTERGRIMRRFFIAPEGGLLIDADYSQIELRVLAHISDDRIMLDAFENNADIHTITASQVFGVGEDLVSREMRNAAKAVNFGIVYGMGAFSLSKEIGVTVSQADDYIKRYLSKYAGVREYLEKTVSEARDCGYVKTLMGRIRRIPEIRSSNHNIRTAAERIAKNTPIQGTAADIIKIAMVRVYNRLKTEDFGGKLILQVHDELIVEAPETVAPRAAELLREEMVAAGKELGIGLTVDVGIGKSWYETH